MSFWSPVALVCFNKDDAWNVYFPGDMQIFSSESFCKVRVLCAERMATSMSSFMSCFNDVLSIAGKVLR